MSTVLYAIPTLGTRNDWLRQSIASVQSQLVDDLQVVVVAPAGSSAAPVAASMGVECLASDRRGLSAAINDAWRAYGGRHDYVGWLADDDVLSPIALLAAADHLDRHSVSVAVYGRLRAIRADGSSFVVMRPGRLAAVLLPYGTQQVPGVGNLFRAEAVRRAGYLDEGLRYAMDYDLFLKLRRLGSLDYLPLELAAVRVHPDRITENHGDGEAEARAVQDRHFSARQARLYRRLRWAARAADRAYGSVLRRMPAYPAVRVGRVPYTDPAAHVLAEG
jgi:glycosyltransferase involved in cell wall biosynthesis